MRVLLITIFTFFCLPVAAEVSGPTFKCESYRSDRLKSADDVQYGDDIEYEHPYVSYITFNNDKTLMYYHVEGENAHLEQLKAIWRVTSYNNSDNLEYARYAKFGNMQMAKIYTTYFDIDGNLSAFELDFMMDTRVQRTEYKCEFSGKPFGS
jgi:hypothetical protein